MKTVYLIRHAESEENRRLGSLKKCFVDLGRFSFPSSKDIAASVALINIPAQVDSDVSDIGEAQIAQVAQQLRADNFMETHGIELVAHSPLKRARSTCEGMLECAAEGEKVLKQREYVKRVVESGLLIEKTPAEWIPGNFGSFQTRMNSFEAWLGQQEESKIAIVGHSQFFKALLGLDFKFGNCDVWQLQYSPSGQAECDESEEYKVPRGWLALKRLYTYEPVDASVVSDAPVAEATERTGTEVEEK